MTLLLACGGSKPQTPADPTAKPAGDGWYCMKNVRKPDYQRCFRDAAECDTAAGRNREVFTACASAPVAYCFTQQRADIGLRYGDKCPPIEGWEEVTFECTQERWACEKEMTKANERSHYSKQGKAGPNEECLVKKVSACTAWE